MYQQLVCAGALVAGLATIGATDAHAQQDVKPIVEHFADAFTGTNPFLSDLCGFDVQVDVEEHGTVRLWTDGRIHVTQQGTVVLSNPATGTSLVNQFAVNFRGEASETFNADGTLTVAFDDTHTGIPEWWRDDDGNTLVKDRGYARFVGEFVIDLGDPADPTDDQLVAFDEEVTVHGPHPIAEQGGLDPRLACRHLGT